MNKKKYLIFIIFIAFVIFIWVIFYYSNNYNKISKQYFKQNNQKDNTKNIIKNNNINKRFFNPNDLEIKKESFLVKWTSMQPLINNWDKVTLLLNYYNSWFNKIKSWDTIIFENNFTFDKIIKNIKIVPWDELKLNYKDWTVFVNNKLLVNSQNKEYKFNKNEFDLLKIYIKDNKMINNNYYLLWDNINTSIDSRNWWPISKEWILWKVELIK